MKVHLNAPITCVSAVLPIFFSISPIFMQSHLQGIFCFIPVINIFLSCIIFTKNYKMAYESPFSLESAEMWHASRGCAFKKSKNLQFFLVWFSVIGIAMMSFKQDKLVVIVLTSTKNCFRIKLMREAICKAGED